MLKVRRKVSGTVSLGELLTKPPTLTSTESRPAGRQAEGGNRWRAAELRQIGGQGVMSRRGESGMTGSRGGAGLVEVMGYWEHECLCVLAFQITLCVCVCARSRLVEDVLHSERFDTFFLLFFHLGYLNFSCLFCSTCQSANKAIKVSPHVH